MLFKELVLNNYKIYYGPQVLNFEIPKVQESPYRKNLILVGGLNGAGKTTILNGIHYALFGRQGMTQKEYEDSFTSAINDRAFDEGVRESFIELTLEDENETIIIKVTWSFDHNKKLINENRHVFVQTEGFPQKRETYTSAEEYLDFINRRIPFDVSPFFIFDGEKIQDLVVKQDQKLMKDSIQKIVSLDEYKSLVEDLEKIQNSMERKLSTAKSNKELSEFLKQIEESTQKIDTVKSKIKELDGEIEKVERVTNEVVLKQRSKIIQNTNSNIKVAKRISEYETRLSRIIKDLEQFAKGGLTKILLSLPIQQLKKSLLDEKNYLDKKAQHEAIRNAKFANFNLFIDELLSVDMNPELTNDHKEQLRLHGKNVWAKVNSIPQTALEERTILHDISPRDREKLQSYSFGNTYNVKSLLEEKGKLEKLIENANKELENAPDPIDTVEEDNKIKELREKLGGLKQRLKINHNNLKKHQEIVTNARNHAQRIRKESNENSQIEKQYDYVTKLKQTATNFVEEMTELKATQIRSEFESILEKLARKEQDFDEVEFDQNEYIIRIFNDKGVEIQLKDRSAGEKQIIALSFIWALTKTAGLSLPFVIDTPLGRLDSIHRNHIIRYYFNALSDQVIILSTDTEVNHDYIDFVSNYMVRGYELVYDQMRKSTSIQEGYFTFSREN